MYNQKSNKNEKLQETKWDRKWEKKWKIRKSKYKNGKIQATDESRIVDEGNRWIR